MLAGVPNQAIKFMNKDEILESIEKDLKEAEKLVFYEQFMDKKTEALFYINNAILACKIWKDKQ